MKHIDTSIEIEAPPATVWAVLTDFGTYPEWNPRSRITGVPAVGERLVVAPGPDAEGMPTFRPRVLAAGPAAGGADPGVGSSGADASEAMAEPPAAVSSGADVGEAYELRWLGHLWVRGLFDGEHSFRVESIGGDRSRLVQSESFSGVLAGLLLRRYGADTEAGFRAVNESLKARAESLAGAAADETATATA